MPSWASAITVGEWGVVTSTSLSASGSGWSGTAPGGSGNYTEVVTAWGGGILNTTGIYRSGSFVSGTFLVLFGGGHNNYAGNELYALGPLDSGTPTWSRINDPTIPAADNVARTGGYPVSRHTYDSLVYLPTQNKMLCIGSPGIYSGGTDSLAADVFDFGTNPASGNPWSTADTGFPTYSGGGIGVINMVSGYDPTTGKAWGLGKGNSQRIGAYTAAAGTWADWAINNPDAASDADGALDYGRSILVHLTATGGVRAVDLRSTPAIYTPTVTGSGPGVSGPIEYDPDGERFVMWPGSGTTVYFLTPSASPYGGGTDWAWTSATPSGGSTPTTETTFGTYGRMRVVSWGASRRALLLMPTESSSIYAYRMG